uniref:Formamidopyrimidine-DNA glycosylase catalytic domain-containing protein n=1 Tax=Mucochytrium quahogii TaxID=96639 RepID=A0A7S2SIE3_9STRA|mmetsp:Transcript_10468/g.17049  ORF Transcript_10468/g.17049 Transcript_10468/m.17049 type:complete len:340 (-) Transcript_10468:103-1122(-)|eukprot:CAMPEP_0203765626 /NCGR_PEP_ID=MMETSP0098-20131031/18513_1 /ASSEMBLY_ACC=CAM_ASM_000208 /TAXON_ID=96639 /ORGANISM=" , Strain NY0313808BC1" /LENGTH=339 /DNA_ID=CAMNT_0050661893 /DNA_START=1325 /DNA_END=2344 /DNA_ORIENTATION=-
MPELPEVERARRLLENHVVGKRVVEVVAIESGGGPRDGLFDDIVFEKASVPGPGTLEDVLLAKECTSASRIGKQMWLEFRDHRVKDGDGVAVLFHHGMTGSIAVKGLGATPSRKRMEQTTWPPRFTKCEVVLDDGTRFAFSDPRRIGRIMIRDTSEVLRKPPLAKLARDALSDMPSIADFENALTNCKLPIKALLLDQQKVIAGIGNWMADEILLQARIHPGKLSNALSSEQVAKIHEKISYIVETASENLSNGNDLPNDWLFHSRWGKGKKNGPTFQGHQVKHVTVGGRTTAFVPALLRLSTKEPAPATQTVNKKEQVTKRSTKRTPPRRVSKRLKAK